MKGFIHQNQYSYKRFPTRVVNIGGLAMGGSHPIRIQSMVNTAPDDVTGTVNQIVELAHAGCELVRLAVPSMRDAGRIPEIRDALTTLGLKIPLVADVHFNPGIAELCARYMEKVRINPGNYRTPGEPIPAIWDTHAWENELEQTEQLLKRLIHICRQHGTVIRVGSNHGSLSPRIMSRYGDTPEGMVEAALEFVRIFHRHNFHDLVLSMKSSNVRVMVQAYRLLVSRMEEEGFDYPLHLGVTEAGFGTEGRIKSAAGIGLLLDEGIGDTIRVSLTEDPVAEIPVARTLLARYTKLQVPETGQKIQAPYNPFAYARRRSRTIAGIGGNRPVVVVGDPSGSGTLLPDYHLVSNTKGVFLKMNDIQAPSIPLIDVADAPQYADIQEPVFVRLPEIPDALPARQLGTLQSPVALVSIPVLSHPARFRSWIALLDKHCPGVPVIAEILIPDGFSAEELAINAAVTASGVFTDGLADGLWIEAPQKTPGASLSFSILQATRARFTSTEYISCPSCGRTRFNIQEAVIKIRERTSHLPGLKIGVMGCIVNGPGEMADADYGYVGAGNHSITLYKGKEVVQRGIHEDEAIDALIELIRAHGDWTDPPQ